MRQYKLNDLPGVACMDDKRCWDVFQCNDRECPVFISKEKYCWLVSGTHCNHTIQGQFIEKMEMCLDCEAFKRNMRIDAMQNTISLVNRQFKAYRKRVEERDAELECIGMDLSLGLSECFEMLRKLRNGDPSARIKIISENELIAKLQAFLNETAENLEEMVEGYHGLAIGLCEHYDTLKKISNGDRTARASEESDNELIVKLGQLINQVTSMLSEVIKEMEMTSIELALGLSENFEVLRKVADGNLDVRAPESSKDVLVAKLGVVVNQTIDQLADSWDDLHSTNQQLAKELKERLRAEQALRLSEEKYRTLTENINVGIFRTTPGSKGQFLEANRAIVDMFEYESKEEFIKKNVSDLYKNAGDRKKFSEKIQKEGAVKDEELLLKKQDGTPFFASITGTAVHDAEGNVLYYDGIIEDITLKKEEEKKRQLLIEQLESANKELKDFAYIVSHDLKAPLRAIGSLVDWLSSDYEEAFDEEGQEMMSLLLGRVNRMNDLIKGILEYSRVGRICEKMTDVDLNLIVKDVIELLAPPPSIDIKIIKPLPTIRCEKTRIEQVFENLISNGIKYMDKSEGSIEIDCQPDRGNWKFIVSDNGPGIEEKYHEKIFQIFQTLAPRDQIESTGVGLSVVKKIIEHYDGRIWVESKTGSGSRFYFTLPILSDAVNTNDLISIKGVMEDQNA